MGNDTRPTPLVPDLPENSPEIQGLIASGDLVPIEDIIYGDTGLPSAGAFGPITRREAEIAQAEQRAANERRYQEMEKESDRIAGEVEHARTFDDTGIPLAE